MSAGGSRTIIPVRQEVWETDIVRIRWRVRNEDGTHGTYVQDVSCPPRATREAHNVRRAEDSDERTET